MTCVVPLQKYPQPKGQKKKKIVKYGMGGLIILFLIAIIWFPLLFMSLVRSVVGVVNQPVDVTVTLKLGGYEVSMCGPTCPFPSPEGSGQGGVCHPQRLLHTHLHGPVSLYLPQPLFTMSAQQPSIIPFTAQAYEELSRQFDPHPVSGLCPVTAWWGVGEVAAVTEGVTCTQLAMQFISQYSPEDIVTAQIEGSSGALWRISPPSRAQMKRELYNGTADITLRFTWNFQRCVLDLRQDLGEWPHHSGSRCVPTPRDLAKGGTVEYANEKHMLALAPNSTARRQLASLLEGTSDQSV